MKRFLLSLGAFLILTSWVSGTALGQKKKLLYYGSTSSSSSLYSYCVGVAKAVNLANPDVIATVIETGATVDNIIRLSKNKIDWGIAVTAATYEAYHGLGQFNGNPLKDLRMLWVSYSSVPSFVVRADSGVKTLRDLEGKSFSPGFRGSATEVLVMQAFDLLKIKPKWLRGGLSDITDAVKDARSVGYAKALTGDERLDASTIDLATFIPIRVLVPTEAEVEIVLKAMPQLSKFTIPADLVKGMPEFKTFGNSTGDLTTTKVSPELGYKIFKAVVEDKTEIAASFPPWKNIDMIKNTLTITNTPLHIGAIRFLREKGYKIPDHLIPPEGK